MVRGRAGVLLMAHQGRLLQGSQATLQWLGDHMVPPSRTLLQRHLSKLSHRDGCHSVLTVGKAETLFREDCAHGGPHVGSFARLCRV